MLSSWYGIWHWHLLAVIHKLIKSPYHRVRLETSAGSGGPADSRHPSTSALHKIVFSGVKAKPLLNKNLNYGLLTDFMSFLVKMHTLWQRTTVHILPWYYHQFVGTFQNCTTYKVTDLHREILLNKITGCFQKKGNIYFFQYLHPIFTRGSNKFHPKILMRGSPLLHLWKALIQLYINTTHNWFLVSLAITSV